MLAKRRPNAPGPQLCINSRPTIYCKRPPAPGKRRCSVCIERARVAFQAIVAARRPKGLCVDCGQPARDGARVRFRCVKCRARMCGTNQARIGARLRRGLCVRCGREPKLPTVRLGAECHARVLASKGQHRARIRAARSAATPARVERAAKHPRCQRCGLYASRVAETWRCGRCEPLGHTLSLPHARPSRALGDEIPP